MLQGPKQGKLEKMVVPSDHAQVVARLQAQLKDVFDRKNHIIA